MTSSSTPPASDNGVDASKAEIREQAHARRNAQPDKDEVSRVILDHVFQMEQYEAAERVLFYVDVRAEVRTRHALPAALESGKTIYVPWCRGQELELFHLESMDELEIGKFKILEPSPQLRELPERKVEVANLDLILVPGVGFDERGARMGHGFGYYDKLLANARANTPLVALAFDCQMFPEIPCDEHDVFMDYIVTESGVKSCQGRAVE